MTVRQSRVAILAVAGLVTLAACGGGGKSEPTSTTRRKPAPSSSTTASTSIAAGAAPLTGVPGDPAALARAALVVKLDNAPKGRPQAGINQADVVVSEKVEDGVTRLFTVFHSADADPVGPVRSARSTDISLVRMLNRPLFAYSGANNVFLAQVKAAPLVEVGHSARPSAYSRRAGRPAPYNLFTNTTVLRATPSAGPPPPWFSYRAAGQGVAAAGAVPAGGAHIEYLGKNINTVVDYQWNPSSGGWDRTQDGTPFVDAAGVRVSPRNVVVQMVDYVNTGLVDKSGAAVPEANLVGSGEAWVLTDGKVVKGTWTRANENDITRFTGPDGAVIALTPGQTWIELAVRGNPNKVT